MVWFRNQITNFQYPTSRRRKRWIEYSFLEVQQQAAALALEEDASMNEDVDLEAALIKLEKIISKKLSSAKNLRKDG